VIPIHWDDKSSTLTIGTREGSFPGMLESRTFHVVIVGDGRGTGIANSEEPDATVAYDGKAASVHVQPKM
jgi:alpha-D-xyloside xylohydrolase